MSQEENKVPPSISRRAKIRFLFITMLIMLLVGAGAVYRLILGPLKLSDNIIQEGKYTEALVASALDLHLVWRFAEVNELEKEKISECMGITALELKNIDRTYFQCNPDFFRCFVKVSKNQFTVPQFEKIKLKIIPGDESEFVQISSPLVDGYPYGIKFTLSNKSKKYQSTFQFEDTCSDIYLPERIYAEGPVEKAGTKDDFRFDNFNQAIYVDKFLVTFRDIKEWIENDPIASEGVARPVQSSWPYPAHHLTEKQMRNYCAFRGKQLMEAHIYDALSFYPPSLEDPYPVFNSRGPYPWTKKFKDSFLFMAMHDPKFDFQADFCKQVFVKECRVLSKYKAHDRGHVTWNGAFQVMGGVLEAMRNSRAPKENLRASSYYFPAKSPWHQLGRRASWDGLGFTNENIDWGNKFKTQIEESDLKISFRCEKRNPVPFEIGKVN